MMLCFHANQLDRFRRFDRTPTCGRQTRRHKKTETGSYQVPRKHSIARVRVQAVLFSGNNFGQVVRTDVPISPSSAIWYQSVDGDAGPRCWRGDDWPGRGRRITVASHWSCATDLSGLSTYKPPAQGKEMSIPPKLLTLPFSRATLC